MPKRISTIKPIILDHAIALFGDRGEEGVTTRNVAVAAGVTEGSIYRLFKSKKNLYHCSVSDASRRAGERLGQMLRDISSRPPTIPGQQLADTLLAWFHAFPRADARIFQQVLMKSCINDCKLRQQAEGALSEIVAIAAGILKAIEAPIELDPGSGSHRAELIVMTLFHHKVTQAAAQLSAEESESVSALVSGWVDLVAPR
ncbi:MAG TPA: TetR/AcrR family transcriptional regulator [Candidatus Angelobacter sp.]|jgi:AcrR family transcriptional regulator|nr:TetR/AcrR family transcriptional regulator [Candidatus Angelobacter sp.]